MTADVEQVARMVLAEGIAMRLSLVRFTDEESDRMIELTMREAWPLANAIADMLLANEAEPQQADEDAVFDALLDDWDYGNCPGNKLTINSETVWLYERDDVRQWLLDAQKARKAAA